MVYAGKMTALDMVIYSIYFIQFVAFLDQLEIILADKCSMDVIIIDDDKFMKTVFSNLFKDQGISFDVYEDPHEGLESISSNRPHCAIIDYNMPALNLSLIHI